MDWSEVGETVADAAPLVGGLLGGPAGGAVGGLVARALGSEESPDKVLQAFQGDPEARAKLQKLEQEHERDLLSMRLEAENTRLAEINKTMRAEYGHEGVYKSGWRPFIGWVFGLSILALVAAMVYAVVDDPSIIANESFTGLLTWLFVTMAAVLGVNIDRRSRDKQVAAGKSPSGGVFKGLLGRLPSG